MDQKKFLSYRNSFLGYNRHNGITLIEIEEGRSVVEVKLTRDSMNPQGNAHGGLIYSLADTAGGCAALTHGRGLSTLSGNVNYIRPGKADGTHWDAEGHAIMADVIYQKVKEMEKTW